MCVCVWAGGWVCDREREKQRNRDKDREVLVFWWMAGSMERNGAEQREVLTKMPGCSLGDMERLG